MGLQIQHRASRLHPAQEINRPLRGESEKPRIKSAKLKELRLQKEAEQLAAGIPGSAKVDG